MEHKEFDGQRLANDFLAGIDKRPIKGRHTLATLGSATRLGGEIATASSSMHVKGHRIACVGDIVRYQDGSESRIVSGAGAALTCKGHPMAIVGSTTTIGTRSPAVCKARHKFGNTPTMPAYRDCCKLATWRRQGMAHEDPRLDSLWR